MQEQAITAPVAAVRRLHAQQAGGDFDAKTLFQELMREQGSKVRGGAAAISRSRCV